VRALQQNAVELSVTGMARRPGRRRKSGHERERSE
jgi:hypothetical protein